ncbi:MAG: formylmethanofuran dehydrogenase [Chloroflexi bacterium]|nr:formylmethanofuran dehydrogenase [Chloroflexota bacterium]
MNDLQQILAISSSHHTHLCPRQVLGARIGLAGASVLGLEPHCTDKRLLTIIETDGCFADGIEAATGCSVGHRTLRVEDYGKIAATFVDVKTEQALRITPKLDSRQRALIHTPTEPRHYFAQLQAYQTMPDDELLNIHPVHLKAPIRQLISRAGVRVNCEHCGEEIINEREVIVNGQALCRACAYGGYYQQEELQLSLYLPDNALSY